MEMEKVFIAAQPRVRVDVTILVWMLGWLCHRGRLTAAASCSQFRAARYVIRVRVSFRPDSSPAGI